MTGRELYESVLALGFAKSLDEWEDGFLPMANLALRTVTNLFPPMGTVEVEVRPMGYSAKIDGALLVPRFRRYARVPLLLDGEPLREGRDYRVSGGCLAVEPYFAGKTVTLRAECNAKKITADSMEAEVDCPEEACHLLPLLLASILWAREDEELSAGYYTRYRAAASELLSTPRGYAPSYRREGGWA